jgi:hypothetical protein
MIKIREILEKAENRGHTVLDTDDAEEISTGLINYLLFTAGTHPNNRDMLKLDEPEMPINKQKSSLSAVTAIKLTTSGIFAKLIRWMFT